jgi:hypothetical protein
VVDHPGAGDRVAELEVAVAVPRERRDAVAGLRAQARERVGELARALVRVTVGIAMDVALDAARDDLGVPVVPVGVADQRGNEQWRFHHQTVHDVLLLL